MAGIVGKKWERLKYYEDRRKRMASEKKAVRQLRASGTPRAQISEITGLSESTIRMIE